MQAQIEHYGRTRSGEVVDRITLQDGLRVELLTYGGVIARLMAPGRNGPANVVLGLSTLDAYETRSPSFGATIGRYANRIAGARFTLDGTTYELSQNEGDNTLHGGRRGFGKRVWTLEHADRAAATLLYVSQDGEEGFPGRLTLRVRFSIEGTTLRLGYTAETDRPTVLNLTNHSYFNLAGEGSGSVWRHILQIPADQIVELRANGIPTGKLLDVAGTPFDFRTPTDVGARVRDAHPQIIAGLGYDACFVLRGSGMRAAAIVSDESSGRVMTVRTDQPAVQVYSANKLTGALVGPSGRTYRSGDGLCFETQHFPDSPNHPGFPSTVLRPGTLFRSTSEYVFSVG
ncbi:MAG: aldose epimerase family protein [Acetobacteraceae bacterium]|nr:aldose epimerase family protein [Acetobacteraceae bacterium]